MVDKHNTKSNSKISLQSLVLTNFALTRNTDNQINVIQEPIIFLDQDKQWNIKMKNTQICTHIIAVLEILLKMHSILPLMVFIYKHIQPYITLDIPGVIITVVFPIPGLCLSKTEGIWVITAYKVFIWRSFREKRPTSKLSQLQHIIIPSFWCTSKDQTIYFICGRSLAHSFD